MSDETLRLQARAAIRSKRIPDRGPERMWSGSAASERCAICHSPVGGLGIDLEFAPANGATRYPVHIDCFEAWKLECESMTPG